MNISKEEWLKRCAAQLVLRSGIEPETAAEIAETVFESAEEDLNESPEECADEEMSYWDNDE